MAFDTTCYLEDVGLLVLDVAQGDEEDVPEVDLRVEDSVAIFR